MKFVAREFYLIKPFKFTVKERMIESVPKGYLLLKPLVAGICGSDILYFRGEKEKEKLEKRLPVCLLHEGVAEIVETGEATRLNIGSKVVVNPMIPCGKCCACRRGKENLCQSPSYMAATADGLARTYFLYPEKRVLPIPKGVELEVAALTEPLTIALNAFEEAQIQTTDSVAIIGDGTLGYFLALIASHIGKVPQENLHFIGIVAEKLSLAKEFALTINLNREKSRLFALYGKLDVCFEAVGGEAHEIAVNKAINLLKPGGTCVLLGISKGEMSIEIVKIVKKGLTFKGSMYSRMEHYTKLLELLKLRDFQKKVKRTVFPKKFILNGIDDLVEAFKCADTKEGESRTRPGRVLIYFP
jgi:ribitol-5-phosphate 2-dehydrogenase